VKRTFHEQGRTLTLITKDHVELLIDDVPILTSAVLGTEHDFGKLARGRTLIGGLGFGGTLRGALEAGATEIIVVEKLRTIVKLMRGELKHLAKGALDDPRVTLLRDDVRSVIERERNLDTILLDVDNAPEWASFTENARLYDREGLAAAVRALAPTGQYAVWSGYPVDAFVEALRAAGFSPSIIPFQEKGRVQARAYVGTLKPR
jgi:predicted membrane-bound spermidine synthase